MLRLSVRRQGRGVKYLQHVDHAAGVNAEVHGTEAVSVLGELEGSARKVREYLRSD